MNTCQRVCTTKIHHLLGLIGNLVQESHPNRRLSSPPTLDSSLNRDFGLNSLPRVELLSRMESAFDVTLSEQVLAAAETPRDLLRALSAAASTWKPISTHKVDRALTEQGPP